MSPYKQSRPENQQSSLLREVLQFFYALLLGAAVATAVAATITATVTAAVAPSMAATLAAALTSSMADALAATMTLPTALALSSTMRSSSVSVFSARFAASCRCHSRFTVCLAFALSMRRGLSDACISPLSVAKAYDACMKTQRMGNLSPTHVISAHALDIPHGYASRRSESRGSIAFSCREGCLSSGNGSFVT
jgi:hypothetical protein